jgi:hypothetical protein
MAFDLAAIPLAGIIIHLLPGFSDQFLEGGVRSIVRKNSVIREWRGDHREPVGNFLSDRRGNCPEQRGGEEQCGCTAASAQEIPP